MAIKMNILLSNKPFLAIGAKEILEELIIAVVCVLSFLVFKQKMCQVKPLTTKITSVGKRHFLSMNPLSQRKEKPSGKLQ